MSRYVDVDKLYDAVSDTRSGSRVIDTNGILEFIETFETAGVLQISATVLLRSPAIFSIIPNL